jgi:hypothetical protein
VSTFQITLGVITPQRVLEALQGERFAFFFSQASPDAFRYPGGVIKS